MNGGQGQNNTGVKRQCFYIDFFFVSPFTHENAHADRLLGRGYAAGGLRDLAPHEQHSRRSCRSSNLPGKRGELMAEWADYLAPHDSLLWSSDIDDRRYAANAVSREDEARLTMSPRQKDRTGRKQVANVRSPRQPDPSASLLRGEPPRRGSPPGNARNEKTPCLLVIKPLNHDAAKARPHQFGDNVRVAHNHWTNCAQSDRGGSLGAATGRSPRHRAA